MAIAGMPKNSLRHQSGEYSRLAWALVISCAIHLLLWGGYWGGKKLNVWDRLVIPSWLSPLKKVVEVLKKKEEPPKEQPIPELVFVDVSASQAVPDPPKNPKGYSDRNSVAANVNADKITDLPKIDGTQTRVVKTASVEPEKFAPLQPSPPAPNAPVGKKNTPPSPPAPAETPPQPPKPPVQPEPKPKVASEEPKPKAAQPPGDLAMVKPGPPAPDEAKVEQPPPRPTRPRTIEQALAQLGSDRIPGQKMKQDGGVARQAIEAGFDVAASPFGAYDRNLIQAVTQKWYGLLDARDYASDSRGKVVVQFRLYPDGRVTDVNVSENSASDMMGLLCQKALTDPAPYPQWSGDMKRAFGAFRSIQFTFYYE